MDSKIKKIFIKYGTNGLIESNMSLKKKQEKRKQYAMIDFILFGSNCHTPLKNSYKIKKRQDKYTSQP